MTRGDEAIVVTQSLDRDATQTKRRAPERVRLAVFFTAELSGAK